MPIILLIIFYCCVVSALLGNCLQYEIIYLTYFADKKIALFSFSLSPPVFILLRIFSTLDKSMPRVESVYIYV